MTLAELRNLLTRNDGKFLRLRLPRGNDVPLSFHVTEVGRLDKTFLDCGGTLRHSTVCQLQIWVGEDDHHRIETRKLAAILEKAAGIVPEAGIPVEFEYEDLAISQYSVSSHEVLADSVVIALAPKRTSCLASELCGLPSIPRLPGIEDKSPCCGPAGCC